MCSHKLSTAPLAASGIGPGQRNAVVGGAIRSTAPTISDGCVHGQQAQEWRVPHRNGGSHILTGHVFWITIKSCPVAARGDVQIMPKRNQHVVPTKDGWAVRRAGSPRATKVFDTQREVKFAVKHVSARTMRRIRELAAAHRVELLKEWERSQVDG